MSKKTIEKNLVNAWLYDGAMAKVHVNGKARARLRKYWQESYEHNLRIMMPHMVDELSRGFLSVNGVKIESRSLTAEEQWQSQNQKQP